MQFFSFLYRLSLQIQNRQVHGLPLLLNLQNELIVINLTPVVISAVKSLATSAVTI
jgi:hypothetical protein